MFPSKKPIAAAAPAVTRAVATLMEGLEVRSLFSSVAVAAATPTPSVHQGEMVQADFTAVRDGGGDAAAWSIDWGDGSTSHLDASRSHTTHLYARVGQYTATVSAAAGDAIGGDAAAIDYTILNTPPAVAIKGLPRGGGEGTEGSAITLGSRVVDAGDPADRVYGWTVYRDGKHFVLPGDTNLSARTFTFVPTDQGTYFARLTVLDGQGGMTTVDSQPVAVANAAPSGFIGGVPHGLVRDGRAIYLGAHATDAGADDTLSYVWTLARGATPIDLPDADATEQHLLNLVDGTYTATCTVSDNDGAKTVLAPAVFTVETTLPQTVVTIGGVDPNGDEGTTVNAYATVFGPSAGDADSYQWSVTRDGRAVPLPADAATGGSSFSFTPVDNGDYVISLDVGDDNSLFAAASTAISVANVPPQISVARATSGPLHAGQAVHLTTDMTDAGAFDGHWYNWSITRDGQAWTPPIETRLDSNGLYFTPADAGTYVATVTVHDLDGGVGTADSEALTVLAA